MYDGHLYEFAFCMMIVSTPIRSNKRKIIFFMSQKIHNAKIPKKHACRQRKDTFSVKVNKSEQV